VTPGPVFSSATFVGWLVAGPAGALAATTAIFLPSFVFVPLLGRFVVWTQSRPWARAFLDGVAAASLGLMAGVLVELGHLALTDAWTWTLALSAFLLLLSGRVSPFWLIGAGLLLGLSRALLG
jgi:chromate transporter